MSFDTEKLERLTLPEPDPPPADCPPPAEPGLQGKVRRLAARAKGRLLRVPVIGRGLLLAARAFAMPGAVRRLQDRADELAAAVHDLSSQVKADQMLALRQIREAQRELADELRDLEDQTAARDRQLHWVLARQAEQFRELTADPAVRGHRAA